MAVPVITVDDEVIVGFELPPGIREGGRWAATLAYRVSCPDCDAVLTLPEDVNAGDLIECCGGRYRLTFEYGAYAAEAL